jgi:UDP-N-acetylmuramoyl-tripeptide--D-alanyl-D-alanine ligase
LSQHHEITKLKGVTVINDAYNANPRSMLEAMKTLAQYPCEGRRFMVIGDMLELGELAEPAHRQLGTQVGALSIDYLVTVGEFSALAAQGAADAGMGCKRIASASERECAVAFLKKHIRPGDCLLVKGSRGSKMEEVVNSLTEEIASGRDG